MSIDGHSDAAAVVCVRARGSGSLLVTRDYRCVADVIKTEDNNNIRSFPILRLV